MQPFDRGLVRNRRLRARAQFPAADFLLRRATDDIAARLGATLRDFPLAVDLSAQGGIVADALRAQPRIGSVIVCERHAALLPESAAAHLVCDEEALPFAPASLDLVVSAMALHWVNDLPGTLVQIRRALKPDGLFIAALLGAGTLQELRDAFLAADADISGGAPPRVSPFADLRELGALLQRAGFALPVVDVEPVTVRYGSMLDLIADLRRMGATNALAMRERKPLRRQTVMRAGEIYAERFADADGRLRASFEIVHLSGWAPHASQQQPLRPGSARSRLADALNSEEISAGDKAGPR